MTRRKTASGVRAGHTPVFARVSAIVAVFGAAAFFTVAQADERAAGAAGADVHRATLAKAQDWLSSGRAETAYALLVPLQGELAGDPEFDLLLGQSALRADEPSHAAFAFERCLAVNPLHGLCRLGMARAHMDLREVARARDELHLLKEASPPEPVQEVIAGYLDTLSGVEAANTDTRLTSYIQLGLGYDSNINNATDRNSLALPLFNNLEFQLSRDGRKKESGFAQAQYNLRYSTPIAPNWRFMAEGTVSATGHWAAHRYDTLVSDVNVGLARRANQHQFIVKLQGQNYRLHERDYRNLAGVLAQYSYSVSPRSEFTLFAQGSRLHYPRQRLRNADRYTVGASWMQGLANDRAVTYLTGYGGREKTIKRKAPRTYDYDFSGVRAGGMVLLTPRLQFEAGAGAERRRYSGREVLFLKSRRDTYYDAYAGLNYAINRKLSIRPQYRYAHSHSNIALHDHKRHVFTVNLRYELF